MSSEPSHPTQDLDEVHSPESNTEPLRSARTGRRHVPRRTSRLRRILALTLATSLAGVAPLFLTAQPAQADVDWDAIAQCESGSRWNINTGNGFVGGLQFAPSTWRANGGSRYARSAHQASRGQQIAVARNVLRTQGIGAWPQCGPRGLRASRSYSRVAHRAQYSRPSQHSRQAARYAPSRRYTATRRYTGRSNTWQRGQHRYQAQRQHRSQAGYSRSTRHYVAARRHYAAPRRAVTQRHYTAPRTVPRAGTGYVVRRGDTLALIASRYQLSWRVLYRINQSLIGHDPNLILPGQQLALR